MPARPPASTPLDRRVLIVSGKGGTGKTTVAAAFAFAAVRAGKRTLLTDVEGREGPAALLGLEPPRFAEQPTPYGFALLSITPREALLEYLHLFFHMGTLARPLRGAQVLETATESIPGFRDLMTAGKLYELTLWRDRSRDASRRPYDLVVVDAPPTGQLRPFLGGPTGFRDLIRVGRPARQLAGIDRLLREESRVVLACVPEEMAVQETAETVGALNDEGVSVSAVVANRVHPPPFPRGTRAAATRVSPSDVVAAARRAGVELSPEQATEALRTASAWDARTREERKQLRRLRAIAPVIELPYLYTSTFGSSEIRALAELVAA
jgi:anion-transporting  ArsA/GET3 family ATPase